MSSHTLNRFLKNEDGAVAVVFVAVLVTLLAGIGAALDYTRAASARTALNVAADSAVLAGAIADESMSETKRKEYVKTWFDAQARDTFATQYTTEVKIGAPPTGRGVTVELTYKAKVPSTFMKVVGIDVVDVGNVAVAALAWPPFTDVHLALDISQSMALAATEAEIVRMIGLTAGGKVIPDKPKGCAFACHSTIYGEKESMASFAKRKGIKLRIHSMRDAVGAVLDTAKTQGGDPNPFRFAIHTFRNNLSTLQPISADLNTAKSRIAGLDLPSPLDPLSGETNYVGTLRTLTSTVGKSGPGSKADPRKAVFIVTDGVQDVGRLHDVDPITPSLCEDLKKRNGVQVAIIYTSYVPMEGDTDYDRLVAHHQNNIPKRLKACASPGLFFEASDGPAIRTGMLKLFEKVIDVPRITN